MMKLLRMGRPIKSIFAVEGEKKGGCPEWQKKAVDLFLDKKGLLKETEGSLVDQKRQPHWRANKNIRGQEEGRMEFKREEYQLLKRRVYQRHMKTRVSQMLDRENVRCQKTGVAKGLAKGSHEFPCWKSPPHC